MFSFLNRYREPLLVGALIIVPLIMFLSRGGRGREPNVIDRSVLALSSPLQGALTWVFSGVTGTVSGYVALRGAHEEATACTARLAETQAELNALVEAKAENVRLKELLEVADRSSGPVVVARVIGLNASPQFQSFRIDRGEDDGVRVNMPVVTAKGVVGHVVRAMGGSADVMVMTDPQSKIGALVQRTRVRGTAVGAGDGSKMLLDFVRREEDIVDGDVVVTAGTDDVFPHGLKLGTVRSVSRPTVGLFLVGQLEPAVDLARVEEVLVLPVTSLSAMRTKETP